MPPVFIHNQTGRPLALGALRAPPRRDQVAMAFTRLTVAAGAADLTQARSLANYNGQDVRTPITDQGNLGACAAFAAEEADRTCANVDNAACPDLSAGWLYEMARQLELSFPNDNGSAPGDCLDIAIQQGIPAEGLHPYDAGANTDYESAGATADALMHRFITSQHAFTVQDGNFVENIWLALDAGYPVVLAVAWLHPWFTPVGGALPDGVDPADVAGGHAFVCWGYTPGFLLCANHWSTAWSADAAVFGQAMRAGDFAIPISYAANPNVLWEARAVLPASVLPVPVPVPDPVADFVAWLPTAVTWMLDRHAEGNHVDAQAEATVIINEIQQFGPLL